MPERPVHLLLDELSQILVELSNNVVDNFLDALHTVKQCDKQSAAHIRVIEGQMKQLEITLEERCLAFLATKQPVAKDLRAIITIIKINDDLKHIGSLAVHIIDRMPAVSHDMLESLEFENIALYAGEMVKKSIEAFTARDSVLAMQVCEMDETIDAIHRKVFRRVTSQMKCPNSDVEQLIAALSISRYIERMADHAARIAHEVVFLVTGKIIRHADCSYEHLISSMQD